MNFRNNFLLFINSERDESDVVSHDIQVSISHINAHVITSSGASTPLTGGGKCLLEKVGKSKKIENWGILFWCQIS